MLPRFLLTSGFGLAVLAETPAWYIPTSIYMCPTSFKCATTEVTKPIYTKTVTHTETSTSRADLYHTINSTIWVPTITTKTAAPTGQCIFEVPHPVPEATTTTFTFVEVVFDDIYIHKNVTAPVTYTETVTPELPCKTTLTSYKPEAPPLDSQQYREGPLATEPDTKTPTEPPISSPTSSANTQKSSPALSSKNGAQSPLVRS